ncbi:hypothetical protein [Sulfurisphaera tokodaii]|uniref:DUF2029 domain-containing protein n=2 Tax=Sulfurisphaera tokodaii TaxID=111955 RepID=Q972Y4_SULTO|nr:hypothetical protein [Sulfurisphaera tokodaii]BAB66029.1 hypothetical protein STK_10050 [Sulfurisphaera tokodaii str. 7]HII73991.1 hypothetical protein [Sulfurisphaera tokodaii]
MEKRYISPLTSNLSEILIWASMALFSLFYYPTLWSDILIVILLSLAGILLFFKGDSRFVKLTIYTELFLVPIEYWYFFHNLYLLLILYLIFLAGLLLRRLDIASLIAVVLVAVSSRVAKPFGTDELMIDYYSAYQFLHGLNPYIPSVTSNVYQIYNLSAEIYGTPYTTGGIVTNLNYPSLSFLLYIPAVIFHFNPNYIILFFYVLLPFILWYRLDKTTFLLFISSYLFNIYYLLYSSGGIDDIIWITFLILSFISSSEWVKGFFYGLSVSFKQDPLIFLPFYLIQLHSERKNICQFLLSGVMTFISLNLYFIISSPVYYFHDIATPVFDNLLQIGFGFDIFSVIGVFFEYKYFFLVSQLLIFSTFFYLYLKGKISNYLGGIYFVMLFMYRMLWNYVMYIPFLNYLDGSVDEKMKINKEVVKPLSVLFLLILSSALVFHYAFSSYYNGLKVEVLHVYTESNEVYMMVLNVSYQGPLSEVKPFFRLFSVNAIHDGNGILWLSNSTWIKSGEWEIVVIKSPSPAFNVGLGEIIINAYYGNINGFLTITVK